MTKSRGKLGFSGIYDRFENVLEGIFRHKYIFHIQGCMVVKSLTTVDTAPALLGVKKPLKEAQNIYIRFSESKNYSKFKIQRNLYNG